jgi:hypothetical protein
MAVVVGEAMVFASTRTKYDEQGEYDGEDAEIQVVDLSSPDAPVHAATLARPEASAFGGLQVFGETVVSWHMRPGAGDDTKVRFYVDRFDASSPGELEVADSINVPGQVVGYDEDSDRVVTVGFSLEEIEAQDCWSHPQHWYVDWESERCTIAHRPLHLLALHGDRAQLLDTLDIERVDGRLGAVMISGDLLFAEIQEGVYEWGEDDDGLSGPTSVPQDMVAVITGHTDDELVERSRIEIGDELGWSQLFGVQGDRAFFRGDTGVGAIDASDPEDPQLAVTPYRGWGCWDPEVGPDAVYCPLGEYGLQVIAIPQD